jgi:hypothetical protein
MGFNAATATVSAVEIFSATSTGAQTFSYAAVGF